jgi:hypothetical protein
VNGGAAAGDSLVGSSGADTLRGEGGADHDRAPAGGADIVSGGAGDDLYIAWKQR